VAHKDVVERLSRVPIFSGCSKKDLQTVARAIKPGLKILFASGYADTAALEAAVGDSVLLHKPFRPAELAAAVRTAIDAA